VRRAAPGQRAAVPLRRLVDCTDLLTRYRKLTNLVKLLMYLLQRKQI
jgi:hypothetical protein